MKGTEPDSLIGMEILNQYRLTRVLATGGMSKVYLADQLSMDRQAAVKIIRPQGLHGAGDWDLRFKREARTASRLQHPNIVTVFNFGELEDGSLFLAMEYVNGVRLGAVARQEALPLARVVNIAAQLATALEYAHDSGVVHRDLKPDNIMITELSGVDHVKILDFGIARVLGEATVTVEGALMGTPRYMSPEQTRGEVATELSDQYALGLITYEMLAGRPAIEADSPVGLLHAQQTFTPPPPSSFSDVAEAGLLDPLVGRMLAKRPADRFSGITAVRRGLDEVRVQLAERGYDLGMSGVPLCRWPVEDGDGSISALPMATHTFRPGARPVISVRSIDPLGQVVTQAGRSALRRRGFHLHDDGSVEPDLWIVRSDWPPEAPEARALAQEQALYWVDRRVESVAPTAGPWPANLLFGPAPYEPVVLSLALNWLYLSPRSLGVSMLAQQEVRAAQVSSSARRSVLVEQVVEDVAREGGRQATQQAVAELCEELLTNALFHAPVDGEGRPRFEELERSRDLSLTPDESPTLAWTTLSRYFAISVTDPFGSVSRGQLLNGLLGPWPARPREAAAGRRGAGLGLRIAARSSRHLICAVLPGTATEILALVPRKPTQEPQTLCVLEASRGRVRLGRNLWLRASSDGEVTRLQLVGEVVDATDLGAVFERDGEVRLDLSGVRRFNSHGIHLWLTAMAARPPGQRLVLERCSLAVVNQINSVPSMTEGVDVRSVFAPYFCNGCGRECVEVVTTKEALASLPPERRCLCGRQLAFDGIVEQHFAFLENLSGGRA